MKRCVTISPLDLLLGFLALVSVLVYVGVAARLDEVGYPLDDAWIHQTYARNLARTGQWAFVPGQVSSASTAPLYTLLLVPAYALGIPHFLWTFGLGIGALWLAGSLNVRLAGKLWPGVPGVRLWTGVLTVLSWHHVWAAASGMETMLFTALALATIWVTWTDAEHLDQATSVQGMAVRGLRAGLIGAALTLTRPEGVILVALAGLSLLLAQGRAVWARWPTVTAWGGGLLAGWLLMCGPAMVWNWQMNGTLLPDTAAAKQAEYAPISERWSFPERLFRVVIPLLASNLIPILPSTIHSAARLFRHHPHPTHTLPLAWAAAHIVTYAWRLPANYQHGRYLIPILPALLLYGVGGTLALIQQWRQTAARRVISRSLALSALAVTAGFWGIGAHQYGQDVRIINTEMVATAKWIHTNLPTDKLLAVHDIGALGYFAPRPILDLAGLISPEIIPLFRNADALMRLMCERQVTYLMVMPDQRPVPPDDPRLGEIVYVTNAPYAPAAGGGNMVVYRMVWPTGCAW